MFPSLSRKACGGSSRCASEMVVPSVGTHVAFRGGMLEHDPCPHPSPVSSSLVGHRARLRERVLSGGLDSASPLDLLELLLCYASPRGDTRAQARRLLEGNALGGILTRDPRDLVDLPGVGPHTASLLALVARIHRELVHEREAHRDTCLDAEELAPWFRSEIGLGEEERFAAVFLDQARNIVGREVFEGGSRTRTTLYPRVLFGAAFRCKATGIVLSHNHPGGTCLPSPQDRDLTRRVAEIGESLEVRLLDHILVTRSDHVSFRRRGWL